MTKPEVISATAAYQKNMDIHTDVHTGVNLKVCLTAKRIIQKMPSSYYSFDIDEIFIILSDFSKLITFHVKGVGQKNLPRREGRIFKKRAIPRGGMRK